LSKGLTNKAKYEVFRVFDFITYGTEKLQLFLMIMLRSSGLFLLAPILGHKSIPLLVRVGMIVLFAIILVTAMGNVALPEINSLFQLVGIAFKELLVGLIIGFVFMLILLAAQAAGSVVGYQIGLYLANVLDPNTHSQVSVIGQFWFLVAMLIFLTINGHHMIISAYSDSFELIPPGYVAMNGAVGEMMIKYTAYLFVIALKIASPVMITLFLTDVALGVVAKMMPTMNVFFVGFPIKIGVGLMVLAMSLPIVAYVLEKAIHHLDKELHLMFLAMGKA
jgi:flagellar biosynthetic protein FliR